MSARLAVVLVLLAAVAVALTQPVPAPSAGGEATTPSASLVNLTRLGCPAGAVGAGSTTVRAGLAPVEPGLPGGPVTAGGQRHVARGDLVDVPTDAGRVTGTGGGAPGLFAARTDADRHTLAVDGCGAPRADWWFTGAGAGLDHRSTLLLTNVDTGPAVVDLRVLGPDGAVDTVAGRGLLVAPRSQRRVDLADVAPQTDELALSLHAERGRVVAAVADSLRSGPAAPSGREWLPGTETPGRVLQLGGLPSGAASRRLLVANPSGSEATIDVQVSGRSGPFTPTGSHPVDVPPGALRSVDLTRLLHGDETATLRLHSTVPVVAAARSAKGSDIAVGGALTPLPGPAATVLVSGAQAEVQLTAGTAGAHLTIDAYGAHGRRLATSRLAVSPGATLGWPAPKDAAYVVVTPRRPGQLSGAVAYAGAGVAAVPLTATPVRQLRPAVTPGP